MVTALAAASEVVDPELPFVTIAELGILRAVEERDGRVTVTITPTYTGCPAVSAIRDDVRSALATAGFPDVAVETRLNPPWTTEWISEDGRRKLADAGIAPPQRRPLLTISVRCPRCGSPETEELSRFGSTACTSLWRCRACAEPFPRVKER
ncbi:ring-1,2-phenylacetyl-CoA epoxidase subunit PaaD [Catenuloplanes nepalensis]|uniref:Ring-1,2-phenylacetyl-CoA epoxidase subunit PaaD n=1 Tax=Catenuloplanes nepalensis TaxID=587533 RepID=A0ABT9N5A4_9ACTN|nr:1,2-phenylacetyl-CoA epoxidase subunit PaaD [Catenuloplanes nepalensis]MDP9798859.1 ring-1,2-phenylacetyl-CoA epoxidase subunit PaaD [Catenuloplanes nepalensis]